MATNKTKKGARKSAAKKSAVRTQDVLRLIPSILGLVQEIARASRQRPKTPPKVKKLPSTKPKAVP